MGTIIDEIILCASEYEMSTGLKPRRLYLGRAEVKKLGLWAVDEGYTNEPWARLPEGDARPEVHGLKVYEVNDAGPHMRCCA